MYGCNKLYCEELGRYYARHYKQLSVDVTPHVDFRAVRFPGLISATTLPSGGTSDYASEMIHAAARGERVRVLRAARTRRFRSWRCPTPSDALLALAAAPRERLTRTTYNVAAFSRSAADIRDVVLAAFPGAAITYKMDAQASGHRGLVAGRRRRCARPAPIGASARRTTSIARSASTSFRPSAPTTRT